MALHPSFFLLVLLLARSYGLRFPPSDPSGNNLRVFSNGRKYHNGHLEAYDNFSSVKGWVEESVNEDTIVFSDSTSVRKASQLLLAYAVDPLGIGSQWTVAYGLPYSLELNYSKLGGGNQFGLRWQALKGRSNFTIGASYASQDYEQPSLVGKAQSLLGYTFERKDIAIPLVWGKTGGNPKKAHYEWGIGLQLQKSTFQYGFSDDSKLMVATWLVDNALEFSREW